MILNGKKKQLLNEISENAEKIQSLLKENSILKAEIQQLKEQNSALKQENNCEINSISSLKDEIAKLKSEINSLKDENTQKEDSAKKLRDEALKDYNGEINRLRDFVVRWQANLPDPKERTKNTKKRVGLSILLKEILDDHPVILNIDEGIRLVDELEKATSGDVVGEGGGFSLDEVLNPSEDLDLAELCKELGVMD